MTPRRTKLNSRQSKSGLRLCFQSGFYRLFMLEQHCCGVLSIIPYCIRQFEAYFGVLPTATLKHADHSINQDVFQLKLSDFQTCSHELQRVEKDMVPVEFGEVLKMSVIVWY